MNDVDILSIALDVGERILTCGGEVWRVEESITRICQAYGMKRVDVFTITSSIVATAWGAVGPLTQTRRVYGSVTDMDKLDKLNDMSRWICRELPAMELICQRIAEIEAHKSYSPQTMCGMYVLASGAFTVFFGGNSVDSIIAGVIGAGLYFLQAWLKRLGINSLFINIACSMICGILALVAVRLTPGTNFDKIAIGNIMPLIPGLAMTNAIRDMVSGDIISGLLRLGESVLVALAIAIGYALAIMIMGGT